MPKSTHTVQSFLRGISFIITLIVLSLLLVPIALTFGQTLGDGNVIIVGIVMLFNLWASAIVAGMFYVLPEWERLVLLRIGKFAGVRGPGYFVIPPFLYSVASIVDTRIITHKVEATATLTKDNVPTKATAAIEYHVEDPKKAILNVTNYTNSIIWLSTEALKNTIGSLDLKDILSNRDEIARQLKEQIDSQAINYGINVIAVRITDIDTPPSLVEELAVIARAKRSSEAKRIQAQAEIDVAKKIAEASKLLDTQKGGFRLRQIQALSEISKEESSTIIIYPNDSFAGKELSASSVSLTKSNERK